MNNSNKANISKLVNWYLGIHYRPRPTTHLHSVLEGTRGLPRLVVIRVTYEALELEGPWEDLGLGGRKGPADIWISGVYVS